MATLASGIKDTRWSKGVLLGLVLALGLSVGLILLDLYFIHTHPYLDSDFFTFWLAGRMNWSGENPYSTPQWLAGHTQQGTHWISDPSFPYPLPLMYFLAPVGLLPVDQAFVLWMYLSQVALVVSLLLLLRLFANMRVTPYVFPLLAGALVFRSTLVTFRNGQLGAFLLLGLTVTAWLWEHQRWFYGGCLLGLALLKPTLGIPIILLMGLWLLKRRHYPAVAGVIFSGVALLILGWLRNLNWLSDFLNAGNRKLTETFGFSPTLWGISGALCNHQPTCSLTLGTLLCLGLVVASGYLLLQRHNSVSAPLALSLVIPVTLLVTPYLWAYDQILLIIPFTLMTLLLRREGYPYLPTALILLVISILAWVLLVLASSVGHDAWSALISVAGWLMVAGWLWRPAGSPPPLSASEPNFAT